ncbi:dipeptidase 1-like isoform X2 [Chelonus insularis]|nr:dipeptidase 1-like isoform X2 [Chelonus insularis]
MVYISAGVFAVTFFVLIVGLTFGISVKPFKGSDALDSVPLIDGHNDLPWNIYNKYANNLSAFHFDNDLTHDPLMGLRTCNSCHTDLPRLTTGKVGGQFWVAYTSCESQYKDSLQLTLRQIDVIKRLIQKYPSRLQLVTDAKSIETVWRNKKIASMIGVEGGHSLDSSLAVLRIFYELGVRYVTLTHVCNTPWADASTVEEYSVYNLTNFGRAVVKEMNRLGIMVDLSHVSHNVMREVLAISKAPVIFSHSSVFSICNHYRNVPDDVLHLVKKNEGVIMINFFSKFINCDPTKNASLETVVAHINYIKNLIGVDHVGIGSDYDGVDDVPEGLEDVSKYPKIFDRLFENRENEPSWTKEDLEKLAGRNLIRVFRKVETVRDSMTSEVPSNDLITGEELMIAQQKEGLNPGACQTSNEWKKVLLSL